jgi:leader peptidase (prepilin peptidase)/N-methyltransferase
MDQILSTAILCFVFGAIVGSFLGVCVYRIPMARYEPVREGIRELAAPVSIFRPARSFCPQCERQLVWYHNVPVVSYLLLRGRCAYCAAAIPFRYLLIELLTGALCTATYLRFGLTPTAYAGFALVCALIVIAFIDLDYMIIPDIITLPGTILGLALAATNQYYSAQSRVLFHAPFALNLHESVLGLLCGPVLLLAVWALYWLIRRREGLGLGDIKLLAGLGAACGPECAWFTILVGSILGSLFGFAGILFKRTSFTSYIPFGPYLVVAALAYVFKPHALLMYLFTHEGPSPWRVLQGIW